MATQVSNWLVQDETKTKHSDSYRELYKRENPEQMENVYMHSIWEAQFILCIPKNRTRHTYFIFLKTYPRSDNTWFSSLTYDANFPYLLFLLLKSSIFFLNPMAFRLHFLFTKFSFIKGNLNLMQNTAINAVVPMKNTQKSYTFPINSYGFGFLHFLAHINVCSSKY